MVSEQNIFWFIGIYSAVEGIFKLGVKYAKQMWTLSTKSRGIAGALVTKPLLTLGRYTYKKVESWYVFSTTQSRDTILWGFIFFEIPPGSIIFLSTYIRPLSFLRAFLHEYTSFLRIDNQGKVEKMPVLLNGVRLKKIQ